MPYTSTSFIKSYVATAKVLEIQNSAGGKVYTWSVCNYQKSYVDNTKLVVILEDNNKDKSYFLDFINNTEATNALIRLKDAINTLKINCLTSPLSPPSPSQTPIPITYLEYKNKQQSGTLFISQWYDVTDTTNLLNLGGAIIRLLAKSIDDYEPSGIILGSKALVTLVTLDDSIQRYEEGSKRILGLNNSRISYDSISQKLTATTASTIIATSSTNIEVNNASTAILNNCNYVTINNHSNVTLNNASQVVISGIQQDLTTIGFDLQDVKIDRSDSIGKLFKEVKNNITASFTLTSYKDAVDQELSYTTSNNTIDLILDNKIPTANGEFRILYSGSGSGNIINVKNTAGTVIYQLTDITKTAWGVFKYNKSTNLFEFINLQFTKNTSHTVYTVTVSSANQTIFSLPVAATDATKLQMIINGQDQLFGPDFTYSNPGNVIYQNRNFNLSIGDEIKFLIY